LAKRRGTLEGVGVTPEFWRGRRVFLTGHTGFKGGWLALWLESMGAEVHGFALAPLPGPAMFHAAQVESGMASSTIGDIRDPAALEAALRAARPSVVLHLAAQALVRRSYAEPVETYASNVMGTLHLLEAARRCPEVRSVVVVTTDKCYDNREWEWGYRENEAMGGADPYSSSKGCAELVTAAWRHSYFAPAGIGLASARAGNVIGGGDWAEDRLLPDILRALDAGTRLEIRSPEATRPWQHVLEPLSGYLTLAERLVQDGAPLAEGWNFGPADSDARSVRWIVETLAGMTSDLRWHCGEQPGPHEARYLKLDSSKARQRLQWAPRWDLRTALARTLEWHQAWRSGASMRLRTFDQIAAYVASGPRD
jgi:CDP-glucose 4,6-dehydratase